MLIEQAFMALPEFLLGAPYLQYEEEGTLAMAFSMALLQELNGRNIDNPISLIRGEVRYSDQHNRSADLHMRFEPLDVLTDALRQYGYREEAWIEAKFFRRNPAGRPRVTATPATLSILADLIRLACLPRENVPGSIPRCSRYLLHAYQGNPANFLARQKNRQAAKGATATAPASPARPAFSRTWTTRIRTPGRQRLGGFRTNDEAGGFDGDIGRGLRGIRLEIDATNFVHAPETTANSNFLIVLTRLDAISVSIGHGVGFTVGHAAVTESHAGAMDAVRSMVFATLA